MTAKSTKQAKATENTAQAAMDNTETIIAAGQETMRNFAKAGTEQFEKAFAGMHGKTDGLANGFDDLASNGKDSLDAWGAASTAYGKGWQTIGGEMMNFAKQMMDQNVAATKAVLGAKSLNEAMELNAEYARSSFDGMMARGTKVGEMATKAAQETAGPLNAQFTTAMETTVEKWRKTAA